MILEVSFLMSQVPALLFPMDVKGDFLGKFSLPQVYTTWAWPYSLLWLPEMRGYKYGLQVL